MSSCILTRASLGGKMCCVACMCFASASEGVVESKSCDFEAEVEQKFFFG